MANGDFGFPFGLLATPYSPFAHCWSRKGELNGP
jgi:hypothetical protein